MSQGFKPKILGLGMTRFGKWPERSLGDLAGEAIDQAIDDAGLPLGALDCVFSSNSVAGIITGQESVRGQIALKQIGLGGVPLFNVENACASGASALHLASAYLRAGMARTALVVGFEKMVHDDKSRAFRALEGCSDIDELAALKGEHPNRSIFMDYYAEKARSYFSSSGAGPAHLAAIAAKNHGNGALNLRAQFQQERSSDEVMASRMIVDPLTLLMCSPISDGAAAIVLSTPDYAIGNGLDGPVLAGSATRSESYAVRGSQMAEVARNAYAEAGIMPSDIDVAEVHDGTAVGELLAYEELGLAYEGQGWKLVDGGDVMLGGRVPVNTGGGLIARGHPIGATGVAQVCELAWQLRGDAGPRQVKGARVGVAHNAGGQASFGKTTGAAAMSVIVVAT